MRLGGASQLTCIIPSNKLVADVHFPEQVKTLLRSLVCDNDRICVRVGLDKKKKKSKSAVDLDSHDAPVLAVRASARSADRLLVSRPAGLHAAHLGEGKNKKKIEDWQSCDWTSIWEKRKDGERGGGRGRRGFKK